jgi:hypothetical protein
MTHEAANDGGTPLATDPGPVLNRYLDETAESTDSLSAFTNRMGRLLADRLDGHDKVAPTGYVMATTLLTYDCGTTGINGFDHEPMPPEVTGQPPMMYGIFQGQSVDFARGAFGDAFADEVQEIYTGFSKSTQVQAGKKAEQAQAQPTLTEEQIDQTLSMIAEGRAKEITPIDKTQAYEVLKKIEGVDPVEAVLDGHPQDIPKEGWVIDAKMELGSSAVINVLRYGEGAEFSRSADWKDNRAKYGEGAIWMSLGKYEESVFIYETPDFSQAQREREPFDRMTTASYAPLSFDRADIRNLKTMAA